MLVTAGATEALAATVLALVGPGDEVLTLEPFYDSYAAVIAMAGATHTTAPLRATGRRLPARRARRWRAAFTDRTRLVAAQHAAQPDGRGADARRARVGRAARRAARRARGDRRGVRAPDAWRDRTGAPEHVPIATLPGMAAADADRLLGGQDVLVHRAGRSAGSAVRRTSSRRCGRSSSSSPTSQAPRSSLPWRSRCPTRASPPGSTSSRCRSRARRDLLCDGLRRRGLRRGPAARDVLRPGRRGAARATTTAPRCAATCPAAPASSACP